MAVKEKTAGPKDSKSQNGFPTALAMALNQAFSMPQLYFDKILLPLMPLHKGAKLTYYLPEPNVIISLSY